MADLPPIEAAQRRSRIPRIGKLIVLTLVVAAIALFLTVVLPYQRQMVAIEHIEALHGIVFTEPVGPTWWRECVGDERMMGFDRIVGVHLRYEKTIATDIDPAYASLQVTPLQIENDKLITDASLEYVVGFSDVEWLDLSDTKITDAGLKYLHGLSNLEEIWLDNTQVTREGIAEFQKALPKCAIWSDFVETP